MRLDLVGQEGPFRRAARMGVDLAVDGLETERAHPRPIRARIAESDARGSGANEGRLLGLDADGNAAALQLVEAEGMPPSLTLFRLDRDGGPSRVLLSAPAEVAAQVAAAVREQGHQAKPLLYEAAKSPFVEAFARANALGFERLLPDAAQAGTHDHRVDARGFAGVLRTALVDDDPPAFL